MGFFLLRSTNELVALFHEVLRVYGFAPGRCVEFSPLRSTKELAVCFMTCMYGFAPGRCVGFSMLPCPNELAVSFQEVLRVYGFVPGRCVGLSLLL